MSTCMSRKEIIEAVADGRIKIAYYAIRTNSKIENIGSKRLVKPWPANTDDDLDKKVRAYFFESLEPDSLTIHVGPYAVVEYTKSGDRAKHVQTRAGQSILNIKDAEALKFYPLEFVLIGSNEYFEVDGTIGASLSSNVRNTDIGLSHVSTIIDPTWQGKLQVGVSNMTRVSKELKYLDALCIVRFHALAAPTPADVADQFRKTRPHWGEDWWNVESQKGRTFFPVRLEYEPEGEGTKRVEWERKKQAAIAAGKIFLGVLGIGSFVSVIALGVDYFRTAKEASAFRAEIFELRKKSEDLDSILKTFHVIKSGSHRFRLKDPSTLRFSVPFDEPTSQPPVILVGVTGLETSQYQLLIEYGRQADANTSLTSATVTIRPTLSGSQREPRELIATWFLARPNIKKPR